MTGRIFSAITHEQLQEYSNLYIRWCEHHPKNCQNGCSSIVVCNSKPTKCQTLEPASNLSYKILKKQLSIHIKGSTSPQSRTIGNHIACWLGKKKIGRYRLMGPGTTILTYLQLYHQNPEIFNPDFIKIMDELRGLYDKFDLQQGRSRARDAITLFPNNAQIIRQWALFYNRSGFWGIVRDELGPKISITASQEVNSECRLAIFESYLNEFTINRYHDGKRNHKAFSELRSAKETYLDRVANDPGRGQQCYFYARYLEELWWMESETISNVKSVLADALDAINTSIRFYCADVKVAYDGNDNPWWLICHKAMLMVMVDHPQKNRAIKEYGESILPAAKKTPHKKSVQVYAITYYLLKDDKPGLKTFLNSLNIHLMAPNVEDVLDAFSFRHAELIFHSNAKRIKEYHEILRTWRNHLQQF